MQETIMMHINNSTDSLFDKSPEIDQGLQKLVLNCLEKDPQERIQTADQLLRLLVEYSEELDIKDFPKEVPSEAIAKEVEPIFGGKTKHIGAFVLAFGSLLVALVSFNFYQEDKARVEKRFSKETGEIFSDIKHVEEKLVPVELSSGSLESKKVMIRKVGPIHKAKNRMVDDEYLIEYLKVHGPIKNWNLGFSLITDKGFLHLDLPILSHFNASSTRISDKTLKQIGEQSKYLKLLEIKRCRNVTAKGIDYLSNLPNLESLSCGSEDSSPDWIDSIVKLRSLNSLSYFGEVSSEDAKKLCAMPNLKVLNLVDPSPEVIRLIGNSKQITYLNVNGRELSAVILKEVAALELDLVGIRDHTITWAEANTVLKKINSANLICGPRTDPEVIKHLRRMNPETYIDTKSKMP